MQRPVRRTGPGAPRRPTGGRPPMRGRPQQRPAGRGPARRPRQRQGARPVRRALRPHDGRTAIFVAGSETLHKFVATRLGDRSDIWIAKPLSQRSYAQGTVYRMKPDVTVVDVDPIWNPTGVSLAKAVAEACPEAHVVVVAPEAYPQGQMVSSAAQQSGWSTVLRRKADNGERLMQAIVSGLAGENWIDPAMQGSENREAGGPDGSGSPGSSRDWEGGATDGGPSGGGEDETVVAGDFEAAEIEEWQERARNGMS